MKNGPFSMIVLACIAQKLIKKAEIQTKGPIFSKCEFSVEMWVGLQISEEKVCILLKEMLGLENAKEKISDSWKKSAG